MKAQWNNPRNLAERIVILGDLILETPTHLGNGDADGPLDMPLISDELEGKPLLTGTSIAGALRNYIKRRVPERVDTLFGATGQHDSRESYLIVDDAIGENDDVTLRDGVTIDPKTRTAEDKKKFDIELLTAGTTFPIQFELLVPESDTGLLETLAVGLVGFENGEIRLGKRKRRGFGRCKVSQWRVQRYDMTTPDGILGWINESPLKQSTGSDIFQLLNLSKPQIKTLPYFRMDAWFSLTGSLLIRSGSEAGHLAPDTVHLHSKRNGSSVPVLSGTSLAGALRARSVRILNTLGKDGYSIVDTIFGKRKTGEATSDDKMTASRLWVEETVIDDPLELVHNRLKIDRFTGGAYPGALFNEQAVWGKLNGDTTVSISLYLENPEPAEIGLLLLLLKDLWTSDLPLGGGSAVGRGRLTGKKAILRYCPDTAANSTAEWNLEAGRNNTIQVTGPVDELEQFVEIMEEIW